MASKSLSEQLAEITNPTPTSHDPEDDIYEETRAQVTGWEAEADLSGDEGTTPSRLRQRAAALLPDLDPRYAGRAVSRKNLQEASDDADSLDGSEDGDEDSEEEDEEDQEEELASEEDEDEDQLEAFKAKLNGVESGTNGLSTDDGELETDSEEATGTGQEDGEEETEEDDEDQEDAGDLEEQEDSDVGQEEEEEEDGEDISAALDSQEDEEGGVELTSRSAGSDAEKGAAVKAQLGVWDQLLECRIKLQPSLQQCGQLPAPGDRWTEFWEAAGEDTAARLTDAAAGADRLMRQLLQLQDLLTEQYPETRKLSSGAAEPEADSNSESDEEPTPTPNQRTRKRRRSGLTSTDPAKRFAAYRPYRDQTIQRWNDKTRLTAGRATAKSFAAFEQSTLRQIEQILSDRGRLLRRTQLRRSDAARLGEPPLPPPSAATEDPAAAGGAESREYDEERFDDSDFYHQLLRELIERKTVDVTDPLALGRQWIQIQKLRSKLKKKVDTRASKGRKVRYEVYPKLVNFMASERAGSMTDTGRDELFGSLFGSRSRPAGGDSGAARPELNGDGALTWAQLNGGLSV
ncbi:protein AATF-like isoform X2 [Amphibalanus amphitrite]|uniref:protein AATF-like isoform X2 n=1 Tax=Amphibalanus amphitrite TaxID=1232801 RepID=UPI001C923569|nr:protein AATF-like isoform X2 [Amphibalanus amphitrite]